MTWLIHSDFHCRKVAARPHVCWNLQQDGGNLNLPVWGLMSGLTLICQTPVAGLAWPKSNAALGVGERWARIVCFQIGRQGGLQTCMFATDRWGWFMAGVPKKTSGMRPNFFKGLWGWGVRGPYGALWRHLKFFVHQGHWINDGYTKDQLTMLVTKMFGFVWRIFYFCCFDEPKDYNQQPTTITGNNPWIWTGAMLATVDLFANAGFYNHWSIGVTKTHHGQRC